MLFHVLGHVEADQGIFLVEELIGQRFGQLGFSNARRAQEEKSPHRPLQDRLSPDLERRIASLTALTARFLPHDPLFQVLFRDATASRLPLRAFC